MDKKLKNIIKNYNSFIEKFTQILSYGVIIILIILLYEVIARYFFHKPTIWVHEIAVYIFGAMAVLSGPYLLKNDQHIRVDLIYSLYPEKIKAMMDIVANIIGIIWAIIYIRYGSFILIETIKYNEKSITPLRAPQWPIRATVPITGVLLIIQAVILILDSVRCIKSYGRFNSEEDT